MSFWRVIKVIGLLSTGACVGWLKGIYDTTNALSTDVEAGTEILNRWHDKIVVPLRERKEA